MGWGNLIYAVVAQVAYQGYKNYKNKKAILESQYMDLLDESIDENAEALAEYEAELRSLPEIQGDGTFSVPLDLTYADYFALEHYSTYLEVMKLSDQPLAVSVESIESGVRIELGQAYMSTLQGSEGDELRDFLIANGGRAAASVKMSVQNSKYQMSLDLANPIRLAS